MTRTHLDPTVKFWNTVIDMMDVVTQIIIDTILNGKYPPSPKKGCFLYLMRSLYILSLGTIDI